MKNWPARLDAIIAAADRTNLGTAWRNTHRTGALPNDFDARSYVVQFLLSCADIEELDGGPGREHRANYWRRLVTLAASGDDDAAATLRELIPHLPQQHGISAELLDHI